MKNLQQQQSKPKSKKTLKIALLAIAAITIAVISMTTFAGSSTSRSSTQAEIRAQQDFQDSLESAQKVYEQKIEAATAAQHDTVVKPEAHK